MYYTVANTCMVSQVSEIPGLYLYNIDNNNNSNDDDDDDDDNNNKELSK